MMHYLVTFQNDKCLAVKEIADEVKAKAEMEIFYETCRKQGFRNVCAYVQKAASIDEVAHKPVEGLSLVVHPDEALEVVDQKKLISKGAEMPCAFHEPHGPDTVADGDVEADKPAPKKKKGKAKDEE